MALIVSYKLQAEYSQLGITDESFEKYLSDKMLIFSHMLIHSTFCQINRAE